MATCRQSQNIFFYIKNKEYKHALILTKEMITKRDKITYEDTFMPIVCKMKGHKAYLPDPKDEPNEWACKRCNRYIKYNLRKEKLKKLNAKNK